MEIINQIVNGGAWWGILHVSYKLFKEFPDIVTKYIDLYLKIKKMYK